MKTFKRLSLVVIFSAVFMSTAYASEPSSGFSVSPTYRNKINPSQLTYEAKPGSTFQDSVTITNHDSKSIRLFIYPVDSKKQKDKVDFKIETDAQTEIGKWATIDQKEVTIEPGASQNITFSMTIPPDAELKDYLGGISSEVRSVDPSAQGSHVNINYRIVTKINLKVTDTPQLIEKLPANFPISPTQAYLYISAGLFVIVLAWFTSSSLRERKSRKTSSHNR